MELTDWTARESVRSRGRRDKRWGDDTLESKSLVLLSPVVASPEKIGRRLCHILEGRSRKQKDADDPRACAICISWKVRAWCSSIFDLYRAGRTR
ncbi:hypothetical protein E2C01_069651 [Portunus trituberculatus]|uniref:Uncharacterized protein n=1 Tax=Portunus trituberculatus TaxID=210409 RepID=A0A5B7HZY6_PORTR|nr:hypothetical protein [Portunus trituberculatus]